MKAKIIEAKFKRSKLELNHTQLWKNLDLSIQNIILENINLSMTESPIVTSFINNFEWWLITDETIYNYNNILDVIILSNISKIEISKNIKTFNENYLNIYYEEKVLPLNLEKKSWVIIIEILKHLTHLNISVINDSN